MTKQEFKEMIFSHAKFYRTARHGDHSKLLHWHYTGHIRAMRAMWDALK